MFDIVKEQRVRKRDRALSLARRCSKSRVARAVGGSGLILCGLTFFGAAYVYLVAGPNTCVTITPTDLSMAQLKRVKKKVSTYQANPQGEIHLDADEASFILADNLKYPVAMTFDGKQMAADIMIRTEERERCYAVRFTGQVEVDQGLAKVTPSKLMVGKLNLSWLTSGQTFEIDKMLVGDGAAGDMLEQTESLRVENSQIHVELEDPRRLR